MNNRGLVKQENRDLKAKLRAPNKSYLPREKSPDEYKEDWNTNYPKRISGSNLYQPTIGQT